MMHYATLYGLGAVEVDTNSQFVQWFENKQRAGWCELYPHLLKLLRAGQDFQQLATFYDEDARNPKYSTALRTAAAAGAVDCRAQAKDVRWVADQVYAVKDYVLGADFGREGWGYEAWCRGAGYALKSAAQIESEARSRGLGGLGVLPVVAAPVVAAPVAVAAIVSVAALLSYIVYVVGRAAMHRATLAQVAEEAIACGNKDLEACKRAELLLEQVGDLAREDESPLASIGNIAMWLGLGVVAVVGYNIFTATRKA